MRCDGALLHSDGSGFRDMRKLHLSGSEELCLVILNWKPSDLAIASVVFDGW